MIRIAALLSAILLTGCVTSATSDVANQSVAERANISLSFDDVGDAPNRVQDAFYVAFGDVAFLADIPFDPGVDGTYSVQGFLSVVGSESGTLLIYVFEFDNRVGQRVVRVSGQVSSRATPEDPWDIVDYDMARSLAEEAIDEFEDWLRENYVGV